jgi:thiopeptide-type bacteriocin biosynthesis protein
MARPVLREHELSFACRSGADPERRIALGDLWLALDGERVVLGSKSLGREVVPRISCALNWAHPEGHACFRLLGALQSQGRADALQFDWGALEAAAFLPRVRAGRAVLSLARWRIAGARLKRKQAESAAAAFRRIQHVRAALELPRFVCLTNDTPLVLDLDNVVCVEELERSARSSDALCLTEVFPEPAALGVRGPEGQFVHEIVVPFVATTPPEPASVFSVAASTTPAKRLRLPGSDWLYLKVYVTPAASDALLVESLAPLLTRALRSSTIDRWFFVRYADPEPHLRVRLHGSPRALLGNVWPALTGILARRFDGQTVFRVELDTYEQEVERYGGLRALELAERIFWHDSRCVLAVLTPGAPLDARRRLALIGVDRLLAAFGLEPDERRALAAESRDALARELDEGSARDERAAFFRAERAAIAELLTAGGGPDTAALRAFDRRDAAIRPAVRRFQGLERARALETPLSRVIASIVHLHVNRLFTTAQRWRELEVLDALARHYRALEHRR